MMQSNSILIRNMVCERCRTAVQRLLDELGIRYSAVHLGNVKVEGQVDPASLEQLGLGLSALGFELLDDKRTRVVERIKHVLRELVQGDSSALPRQKLSIRIAGELHAEYSGLSKLFSEVEGTTIERYHNLLRIERAKELLVYDERTLAQIADELGYSSVQHLSNQFTQFEGHSPTHFKRIGAARRKALDHVHLK